ncbi:MAG: ribosome biogenesis GTPase Der [Trueperaceae bacterium]|nr:ribosome biogenesis GTPase Der [Trueperaceae bacterium]MCW5820631.1 ribosome biogenesis GTPase Der [Trueperaceae bacterium]
MFNVAIVGRPNVGKSSLFNRLVGKREAIVADMPGVTRDVKEGFVTTDDGLTFRLLDTGGLWSGDRWETPIRQSVAAALVGVDLVLLCVDGREGPVTADHQVAEWLRTMNKRVLLVATKLDDPRHAETGEFYELYSLGFGEPFVTAAEHAIGTTELVHHIGELMGELMGDAEGEVEEEAVKVAIIGRPNVGKSSLVNALVGDERVIVADVPGTTRDSVDVHFEFGGRPFTLIDTAGMARKDVGDLEYYARMRSEMALRRADVAILVIDPFEIGDHELRLANLALEWGKPIVMAVNKWDLVADDQLEPFRQRLDEQLEHLSFAPRVYTSALTDFGLHELLATAVRLYDTAHRRVGTSELNGWLEVWTQRQPPPNFSGRPLKLLYVSQVDVAPPTFVFSINSETLLTRPYEHYLRNRIREDVGFSEVPIRMVFKERSGGKKRVRV